MMKEPSPYRPTSSPPPAGAAAAAAPARSPPVACAAGRAAGVRAGAGAGARATAGGGAGGGRGALPADPGPAAQFPSCFSVRQKRGSVMTSGLFEGRRVAGHGSGTWGFSARSHAASCSASGSEDRRA